jgi:hypothetical protein
MESLSSFRVICHLERSEGVGRTSFVYQLLSFSPTDIRLTTWRACPHLELFVIQSEAKDLFC